MSCEFDCAIDVRMVHERDPLSDAVSAAIREVAERWAADHGFESAAFLGGVCEVEDAHYVTTHMFVCD